MKDATPEHETHHKHTVATADKHTANNRKPYATGKYLAAATPHPALDAESALFREPFERLRPEFDAIPEDKLLTPNFDIVLGVTVAIGALPAARAMRAQIATELPKFDLDRFDRLEDYIRAAAYSNALHVAATTPSGSLVALNDQAVKMRDSLALAGEALADRGVFPPERIAEIRSGQGYRDTCTDLMALSAMFRGVWPSISTRTAVTVEDLDQAEAVANRLLVAVSKRDQTDPAVVVATMVRRRAVTAFVNVYDQARRAASYLRWDFGDADTLIPSLYAHSGSASKKDPATPAAPGASSNGASTAAPNAANAGSAANAPPVVAAAHVAQATPPAGVPQNDPFEKA